jgi:tetratricopeptide (TPR) repeat protein
MGIIERTNYTYHLAKDMDRVTIPSTIQDVIMARVDSLPDAAKEVLQAGSVIEREFSYELIKAVADLAEQALLSHLSVLKDAELLYERGIFPRSTYVFRHALTREVVYDSILTSKKKLLHAKIGEAIEEVYKDNINDYYGVLLDHFHASDRYEDAAKYARLASKKAEKTASFNDASLYAEKGVASLERLPASDEVQKKIIDARTVSGLYLLQMGDIDKAKDAVDPITEAAVQKNYSRRLSQIYTVTGTFECWVEEDFPRALEDLKRAAELADRVGDMVSVVMANYWLAFALFLDCQFEQALSHIEQSLKINTAANNLWGISAMKSHQSFFQFFHGQVELSYRTGIEALTIAEQSGDIFSRTCAHTYHGVSCYGRGALEQAIGSLSKGADLGERINHAAFLSVAHLFLAETCLEIGDHEVAKIHCREAVELIESGRFLPSWANVNRMGLEKAQALSGEKNVELERLRRHVQGSRVKLYKSWIRRYLGEILLIIDDQHFSEAQHWIEEAIEADRRNQMMFHLGRDYAVYADLFKRKGDKEKARQQLVRAIDIYKDCGADGWVTKAEEELPKLA